MSSSSSSTMSSSGKPSINQSDSSSTVKVSSPLNPASLSPDNSQRPRGHSASTLREDPLTLADLSDRNSSSFRTRSRSKSPAHDDLRLSIRSPDVSSHTPPGASPSRWWNDEIEKIPRPWKDSPKRQQSFSVPAEQTEGWKVTRERVAQAVHSVLGTAASITHEALFLSVELLDFAPVPGLQAAARTLLNIWDSVQAVDTNRLSCLRLTERCADILLSVRQEVYEAGDSVTMELRPPIDRLSDVFQHVYTLLQTQGHRPFLKRYLKREEILRQISGCDNELQQALEMFGLSVQIRILKAVQASEARRQHDTQLLLETIIRSQSNPSVLDPNALHLSGVENETTQPAENLSPHQGALDTLNPAASTSTILPSLPVPFAPPLSTPTVTPATPAPIPVIPSPSLPASVPSPSHILPLLQNLRTKQNTADALRDLADLRNIMRTAVSQGSDVEMLEVLGVRRDEMPEAIKTLQRALERAVEKEGASSPAPPGDATAAATDAEPSKAGSGNGNGNGNGRGRLGKMVRRISVQASPRSGNAGLLRRSKTVMSSGGNTTSSTSSADKGKTPAVRDTLDLEFMESGIDALRRMSKGADAALSLPSWTITRYEVDREQKIGIGFFSDVYKGTWRGRTVAIKVLAESTPRNLFVHEVGIWKTLRHPNVLELFGASSTSSDPPWFFVSPYERNGSLSEFLRKLGSNSAMTSSVSLDARSRTASLPAWNPREVSSSGMQGLGLVLGLSPSPSGRGRSGSASGVMISGSTGDLGREMDLLRYMHEIAKGMEYLHLNGVLHGDLKAANVLVNDRLHCVISDFGQSELKSEAYRISGTQPPHGTLRWQAPELMIGASVKLTTEMDVYAFAICCIEILSMGRMPWPLMDDESVRHFVLKDQSRPAIPPSRFSTTGLQDLVHLCWHTEPSMRPSFSKIVKELKQMRKNAGANVEDVASPRMPEYKDFDEVPSRPSPDMHPIPLPPTSYDDGLAPAPASPPTSDGGSFTRTGRELSQSPTFRTPMPHREEVTNTHLHFPEPELYTSSSAPPSPSRASSIFTSEPGSSTTTYSEDISSHSYHYSGYDSPPPADQRIADAQNERRYRLLLNHEFHPSLTLPLWTPSPIALGSVGYLSKPDGAFITLFNAFSPKKSLHPFIKEKMPSVQGYGKVSMGNQRQDRRNVAQRGLDAIAGLLTFKTIKPDGQISPSVSRRYSYPLRAGHKAAYLCTESTIYRYVDSLEAPKAWFKANVDGILQIYGAEHRIQKEDLYFIVGTLDTPDYGLFVSHSHPGGQVHFSVYTSNKVDQPWGKFATDTHFPSEIGGPDWAQQTSGNTVCADKISHNSPSGAPWHTVLLARLRFKPDIPDPTSL